MDVRNSQYSQRQSEVVSTMRRSYISSGFSNDYLPGFEDLTRSHIQNQIQSDRKVNLTDNLPFAVVFQTIQIQRLWKQIQTGKMRIRDLERQTISSSSSDVLLREMSEKLLTHERDKERYSQQNEKLNLVCHQLYNELQEMKRKLSDVDFSATDKYQLERSKNTDLQMELDTWKARYTACERSKTKELDDMRAMMDSQRKSMIDRDMREMTVRHQTERSNLENEIRKLRDCLEARNKELDDTRMQFGQYQAEFASMGSTEKKLQDYENKLAMISQQMMRLNELCKSKQQQIDAFKLKQYQLGQKVKDQERWELEIRQLRSTIQAKGRQVEEWRGKYVRLEDSLTRMRDLESQNSMLEKRIRDQEKDVERANGNLREKLNEIEEWKKKIMVQEMETNKLRNLQKEIETYENKMAILTTQVERLNGVLKARLADIEQWKSKHRALENTINSYTVYEKQNKQLNDRLSQQFRVLEDVKIKLDRTQGQLNSMRMYERKALDQEDQLRTLTNQIDRVNNIVRTKHQEVQDFKVRQSKLESTISEYKYTEGKLRDYEDKINALTQQLERVNNVVRDKNDDLQRTKMSLGRLEEEVSTLRTNQSRIMEHEKTIMTLNANLDNIRRQGSRWEEKFRQVESRYKDLESNQYIISQEKDKISNNLRVKTFELEEIRTKYNKLENDSFRAKQMETSFYDLQSKTMTMSTEIERYERTLRSLEDELHKEKNLSMELAFKVIIISAEVERNQNGGGMKSKDYADMQQKLFYLQSGIKDKDSQVMLLLQKVNSFEPKFAYLMTELDRYLGAVTTNQKKMRQLQQQINQYQDYTKRIGILSAEIDRLSSDNKMLDEDTKKIRLKYAGQLSAELTHEKLCMMVVIMGAEIESLRSRLGEKDSQFNDMRRSILEPIRNFEDYRRV